MGARLAAALVAVAVVPTAASAQDGSLDEEQARIAFEVGRAAMSDGRFEDALASFRLSYELSGHPELLYNVGLAADRLRLDDEALTSFSTYLALLPTAENRAEVEGRIRILRRVVNEEQWSRDVSASSAATSTDEERPPLATRWWFWTLVSVTAATVIAAVAIGVHRANERHAVEIRGTGIRWE